MSFAFAPVQAAEFSGPGKHAVVLYSPDWTDLLLEVLRRRPDSYEASWSFQADRRAHVLQVDYASGPSVSVALIDGIHNAVIARLAGGAALVLSPYPLYRDPPDQEVARLFDPAESVALPKLPSLLG